MRSEARELEDALNTDRDAISRLLGEPMIAETGLAQDPLRRRRGIMHSNTR